MKIIIITGKSGSGKTFLASILSKQLNCEHLNLDKISHDTLKLPNIKKFVFESFGENVFENNKINRKKLGEISFKNPLLLNKLNKLCEIEMIKIIDEKLSNCKSEFVILDYLLLPLMKYFDMAHVKILTTASNLLRKTRIISRDNISEEYFSLRDKNSIVFNENDFDFVIDTSNQTQIDNLITYLKK